MVPELRQKLRIKYTSKTTEGGISIIWIFLVFRAGAGTFFFILVIQYQQLEAEHRQQHLSLWTGCVPAHKKMFVRHTGKDSQKGTRSGLQKGQYGKQILTKSNADI